MVWLAGLIALLLLLSWVAGRSSAPSGMTDGKDCPGCKDDFAWYNSLPFWKKGACSVWYAARKIDCAANGL